MASVGLTEEQVKQNGNEYRVGKFPFSASGRAKCMDETEGLVKIIADAKTDRVLGVHIFGPRASDLIAECVTIMEFCWLPKISAYCACASDLVGIGRRKCCGWFGWGRRSHV